MAVMDVEAPLRGLRTEQSMRAVRRRRLSGLPVTVVRQGVLGYCAALAATWLAADRYFLLPETWIIGVVALVGAWLLYSFAALPAYERARSFKPAIRFVEVLGAGTLALVITDAEISVQIRHAAAAVLVGPAVSALSALAHRQLLRRTPTILVGQIESVRRLSTRWEERKDVNVVATCSWRAPHELAPLGSVTDDALAQVVREVLAAVAAHRATSVVIASGRAFATPALRHLAWALQRAEVECLVVADMNDHVEYLRPRRSATRSRCPSGPRTTT